MGSRRALLGMILGGVGLLGLGGALLFLHEPRDDPGAGTRGDHGALDAPRVAPVVAHSPGTTPALAGSGANEALPSGESAPPRRLIAEPPPPRGLVEGVVVGATGKPVAGADVVFTTLLGLTADDVHDRLTELDCGRILEERAVHATTDDQGAFSFSREDLVSRLPQDATVESILASPAVLIASAHGYAPAATGVEDLSQARDVEVSLQAGAILKGAVTDTKLHPIAGARVRAALLVDTSPRNFSDLDLFEAFAWRAYWPSARTGSKGRFTIDSLWPYRYYIVASAPGYAHEMQRAVDAGETRLRFRLSRGGSIRGTITDSSGAPVAGAYVHGRAAEGTRTVETEVTGEDGSYELDGIPVGEASVLVRTRDHAPVERKGLWMEAGGVLREDIRLKPQGVVRGKVVGPSGEPIPQVGVQGYMQDPWTLSLTSPSRADGSFELGGLVPGQVEVFTYNAGTRGYVDGSAWVEAKPSNLGGDGFVLSLERAGSLRGRVVDQERGKPVPAFRILVALEGEGGASSPDGLGDQGWAEFDDPGGTFRVEGLAPGVYLVMVAAKGFARARIPDVDVVAGDAGGESPLEIVLEPAARVEGVVLDASTGLGAGGAWIYPLLETGSATWQLPGGRTVVADDQGFFVIDELGEGSVTLGVSHPSHPVTFFRDIEVPPRAGRLVLRLRQGGVVEGLVTGEDGMPRTSLTVDASLTGTNGLNESTAETDEDGYYRVENLAPGSYDVTAFSNTEQSETIRVQVSEGETVRVDFYEGTGAAIEGILSRGEGSSGETWIRARSLEPVRGPLGSQYREYLTWTDSAGAFAIPHVAAGGYVLQAQSAPSSWTGPLGTIRVVEGQTASIRLELPGFQIRGRVVRDPTMEAIPGATVSLVPPGARDAGAASDEGGGTTIQADGARGGGAQEPDAAGGGAGGKDATAGGGARRAGPSVRRLLHGYGPAALASVHADAEGGFLFRSVAPGTYSLHADAEGFASRVTGPITVGEEAPAAEGILLLLSEGAGGFLLEVVDGDGEPQQGAAVYVVAQEPPVRLGSSARGAARRAPARSGLTNIDGQWRATGLPRGRYHAIVLRRGFVPSVGGPWRVAPGVEDTHRVELSRGGMLDVATRRSPGGAPLPGVAIEIRDRAGETLLEPVFDGAWVDGWRGRSTGSRGSLRVENVPAGRVEVRAHYPSEVLEVTAQIREGETTGVTFPPAPE